MENKIKFSTNRGDDFQVFGSDSVRIKLPSDKQFVISYNHYENGLVINKPYPDDDGNSSIHIKPYQTNEIIIK